MTDFNPDALLGVLHQHDVRYVLIGGLAAALRGSATPTFDVDITPAASAGNLTRLSAALTDLDARIRVEGIPDGLPFSHDSSSLAQMTTLNLVTRSSACTGKTDHPKTLKNNSRMSVPGCRLTRAGRKTTAVRDKEKPGAVGGTRLGPQPSAAERSGAG